MCQPFRKMSIIDRGWEVKKRRSNTLLFCFFPWDLLPLWRTQHFNICAKLKKESLFFDFWKFHYTVLAQTVIFCRHICNCATFLSHLLYDRPYQSSVTLGNVPVFPPPSTLFQTCPHHVLFVRKFTRQRFNSDQISLTLTQKKQHTAYNMIHWN